jgi:hypothetical protein
VSIFDEAVRAVTGFSPQAFSGAEYESVWAQLRPWLGRISTKGVLRWIPRAAMQTPCQVPEYAHGVPVGPCGHHALESCLICGRAVCLSHAFVEGQQGDAVCYLCVVAARSQRGSPGTPGGGSSPFPGQGAPKAEKPPQAATDPKQLLWWARGVLGIQEGVPWREVKKQHRSLSAQYHPDKPGGNEEKFKDIQKALDILKQAYGEN